MTNLSFAKTWAAAALSLTLAAPALAEEPAFEVPTTSPLAKVSQRVASTEIEITYFRPSARGRTIFGGLVPYDEVWRTGADSATQVSFSTPVSVGGQPLDAGTYELFTVPGEKEWTVIFQSHQSQWGSYAYDPSNDAARVTAKPKALTDPVETLTLSVDALSSSTAQLHIAWERVRVGVEVAIDVRKTVVPQLEAALQGEGRRPYLRAAMFYFENDLDIDRAAELIAKALEENPRQLGALYRQALILERKGDAAGAAASAEASIEIAKGVRSSELREEYIRLNTTVLERLRKH